MKKITSLFVFAITIAFSQWSSDVSENTVVVQADNTQHNPLVATAFDGSVYIAWGDRRATTWDYRLKRYDFFGNEIEDYVLSNSRTSSVAGTLEAMSDDRDTGVYVLWEQVNSDATQDELRLQHVNSNNNANGINFAQNGIAIGDVDCDNKNSSLYVIDRDNVIISYTSSCNGTRAYLQKITNGENQWGSIGIVGASRNTNGNDVLDTKLVGGPNSGAFILFSQNTTSDNSLRINYVDSEGNLAESMTYPSGLGLGNLHNKNNWEMDAVSDGASGIYIVWRNTSNKIVLQHVTLDANGSLQETHQNPVEVFSSTASYVYPALALDNKINGEKGVFIAFYDYDNTANQYGLFAKYYDKPDGSLSSLFTVSTDAKSLNYTARETHKINNTLFEKEALITYLKSDGDLATRKIFINASGSIDSTTPEVIIHNKDGFSAPSGYNTAHDRIGGLIVAWNQDRYLNSSYDIYAQQVGNGGVLGVNGNLMDEIDNAEIIEDEAFRLVLGFNLFEVVRPFINLVPLLSDNAVSATIEDDTLVVNFPDNWNGELFVDIVIDWAGFPIPNDTTSFEIDVDPVQDSPYPFDWVSTALDTINITQTNTADIYRIEWTESIDVDDDSITYLLYAGVGNYSKEEAYDTTGTSLPISYQDFLDNVFEGHPMLPAVTVKFSVSATDGIDTVKVTGDDRVVFVNRYDFLSVDKINLPKSYALHNNFPNPFNPSTLIRFDLPVSDDAVISIYNMLGQKVKTFLMYNKSAGTHSVRWNGVNQNDEQVAAGVYFYQLKTKNFTKMKKMVLVK